MKARRLILGIALTSLLTLVSAQAPAQPPGGPPPSPGGPQKMGPPVTCADQQNVYALVEGKIMQYGINDLKLVKSVDLPAPPQPQGREKEGAPQGGSPPPPQMAGPQGPPPFMGGPQGGPHPMGGPRASLWTGEKSLFVMLGPVLYRFSTPDLKLQATLEFPKPECPPSAK